MSLGRQLRHNDDEFGYIPDDHGDAATAAADDDDNDDDGDNDVMNRSTAADDYNDSLRHYYMQGPHTVDAVDVEAAAAAAAVVKTRKVGPRYVGGSASDPILRVRVEKRRLCSGPVLYMVLLGAVCLLLLFVIGVYLAVRISGCWPCVSYDGTPMLYLQIGGPLALIPGPSRAAVQLTESCEIQNGSFYDSIIVAGRHPQQQFGYLKMLNGPGTANGERVLISEDDSVLLRPESLAMDYCDADIFVADSASGGVFHLSCGDDQISFETELCSAYSPTLLEFDGSPMALSSYRQCGLDDNFYLFVAGLQRDIFTGLPSNVSFLHRMELWEEGEEEEGTASSADEVVNHEVVQMLPLPEGAAALAPGTPELANPESLAVSPDRGTILVANTQADTLLEISCAASCVDYANASSSVVTGIRTVTTIRRPRGLYMAPSLNTESYSRVYIVGGDVNDGYVAYFDFVTDKLHYVSLGLPGSPVAVFDDLQRPNASGFSSVSQMQSEESISGLYLANSQTDELQRFQCTQVIDEYIMPAV